jgi:hypothetical protein
MRAKKAAGDKKAATVVVNDPDALKGALKSIGGSQSDDWNNILANQTMQTLWLKHSDEGSRNRQYSATLAALVGIASSSEISLPSLASISGLGGADLLAAVRSGRGLFCLCSLRSQEGS